MQECLSISATQIAARRHKVALIATFRCAYQSTRHRDYLWPAVEESTTGLLKYAVDQIGLVRRRRLSVIKDIPYRYKP